MTASGQQRGLPRPGSLARRLPRGALVALVVLGALLVAGGLAVVLLALDGRQARRDGRGTVVDAGAADAYTLRVGTCFQRPRNGEVRELPVVPCDQPHDAEVVGVSDVPAAPGAPWPGAGEMESSAEVRCAGQFAAYVGTEPPDSELEVTWLAPTQEGWVRSNDRALTCVATSDRPLTGSVRGARR